MDIVNFLRKNQNKEVTFGRGFDVTAGKLVYAGRDFWQIEGQQFHSREVSSYGYVGSAEGEGAYVIANAPLARRG